MIQSVHLLSARISDRQTVINRNLSIDRTQEDVGDSERRGAWLLALLQRGGFGYPSIDSLGRR